MEENTKREQHVRKHMQKTERRDEKERAMRLATYLAYAVDDSFTGFITLRALMLCMGWASRSNIG